MTAREESSPPTPLGIALRWVIALGIAGGGAYAARRYYVRTQAKNARAGIRGDFARFEGCLFAGASPSREKADAELTALAMGSGDVMWPHSCADALTQLVKRADLVSRDEPEVQSVAEAARSMEIHLANAVFWQQHIAHGKREAPTWVEGFYSLRNEVEGFLSRSGQQLELAIPPTVPRIPYVAPTAAPPVEPTPLPGGLEADVVDAIGTQTEFAVLLRDRKSRYAVCTHAWPDVKIDLSVTTQRERLPHATCATTNVPTMADARDVRFAPSATTAHLAVWGRAPMPLRALVDVGAKKIVLTAGGSPDAVRDYYAGTNVRLGVQLVGEGASLQVSNNGNEHEHALPNAVDVLTTDRALLTAGHHAGLAWLDTRQRQWTSLTWMPLGELEKEPQVGTARNIMHWTRPRMTTPERVILPCSDPNGTAWLLAGDAHGGDLLFTDDGVSLAQGAIATWTPTRNDHVACDASGVTYWRVVQSRVERVECTRTQCSPVLQEDVVGTPSITRSQGRTLLADLGGPGGTVRVRTIVYSLQGTMQTTTSVFSPAPPSAREVRVVASGMRVALVAGGKDTLVMASVDGAKSFFPVVVDAPQ